MTPICTILDVGTDITYAPVMVRVLLVLCVTIIMETLAFSQTETSDPGTLFTKYYKDVKSFGLPLEGSRSERDIGEYIAGKARSLGFATQWQAITSEHDYHSFASNLKITIPGQQTKSIAVLIPLDMPERLLPGVSHDPFFLPALMCVLMDKLAMQKAPQPIVLVFLSAESGQDLGLGSLCFLDTTAASNLAMALCLNYTAPTKTVELLHGGGGKVSPSWLVEIGLDILKQAGIPVFISTIDSQLYRLGVGPSGMLAPYLKAGIPTIEIQSHPQSTILDTTHSSKLILDALLDLLIQRNKAINVSGYGHSWDGNYLFIDLNGQRIVPERIIAVLFLASIIAYLVLIFVRRSARHRYLVSLTKNTAAFIGIVLLSFLALAVNTLLAQLFLPPYSVDPIYLQSIPSFFLGKIMTSVAILLGILRLLRPLLPKQSSFYAAAAFFVSMAALVIVATLSLTVSVYLMASTLFICLANLSRSKLLKLVFFIAGSICIIQPVFEALRLHPGIELDRLLLRSIFPGAIMMALISLPLVLIWYRLRLLIPVHRILIRRVETVAFLVCLLGGFTVMVGTLIVVRLNASGLDDLVLVREFDSDTGKDYLNVNGAALLPPGSIKYEGKSYKLPFANNTARINLDVPLPDEPSFAVSTQSFLGRKTMVLRTSSKNGITNLGMKFAADRELIVQSLNFPYRYLDARNILIQIGRNPPNAVQLELTIPLDSSGKMIIEADLPDHAGFQADNGTYHDIASTIHYRSTVLWE